MKRDFAGMELDLGRIGEREVFSFHKEFPVPTQEGGEAKCYVEASGAVVKTGSRLFLDAKVEYKLRVECSRCVCEFDYKGSADFNLVFHRGERVGLPGEEEGDFIFLTDAVENRYDIFPRVREAVILELPMKFLCSENCKGLCSRCGANLNEGDCGCNLRSGDSRWDVLKKLLSEEEDN